MNTNSVNIIFALTVCWSFLGITAYAEAVIGTEFNDSSGLIDIQKDTDGVVSLKGPNCSELIKQDQALRLWTLNLGENPGVTSAPHMIQEDNQCILNISNSIPKLAYSLQGVKTAFNGPNCWNTSLHLSGQAQFSRFSNQEELNFWLNSPYCRQLKKSEPSLPGDIIEIRAENSELHGMIYISDDLVFSKNTSSRSSPFSIQRANLVYQSFHLDIFACRKVYGQPNDCPKWANHYRCIGSQNDRKTFEKSHLDFATYSSELRTIETTISNYAMSATGDYEKNKENIKNQLTDLEKRILSTQKSLNNQNDLDKPNDLIKIDFFLQALLQELNSLKNQIDIIKKQQDKNKQPNT